MAENKKSKNGNFQGHICIFFLFEKLHKHISKEKWRILLFYITLQRIHAKGGGAKGLTNKKLEVRDA